jgi:hypothetical protein
MSLLSSRRGGAATAVLVFIAASLLIVGGFWYFLSSGDRDSMDLADETPEPVENNESVPTVEDPAVEEEPETFSVQDAVDGLEGRGVTVVTVTEVEGYSEGLGFIVEYSEFVKAAVKEEMVLLYYPEDDVGVLLIPYDNSFIVWRSDAVSEDGEPVEEIVSLEIRSAECIETDEGWIVDLSVVNEGNVVAGIGSVWINEVEVDKYDVVGFGYSDNQVGFGETGVEAPSGIAVGGEAVVHVYISDSYSDLSSGKTIGIMIRCGGMDYISLVRLV